MPGSDIVVAELGDTITLKDRYAMGKNYPLEDGCNDWVLVAVETQAGTTYIEMKRKLVTNDPQDRPFNLGTPDDHNANMAVIFAWGTANIMAFHKGNRIATRINFKQPDRPDPFVPIEADDNVCLLMEIVHHLTSFYGCALQRDPTLSCCPYHRFCHLKFAQRGESKVE